MSVQVFHGDCVEVLKGFTDCSFDSVVTDPPYGLEFMGKEWDSFGRTREYEPREGYADKGILPHYGRGGRSQDVDRFKRRANQEFQNWCEEWAVECFRVLKPGGHLLAFGGTRTYHRMACGIEDAGFEVRDSLHWIYGSGFPKSLDISKAIDKAAGVEREIIGNGAPRSSLYEHSGTGRAQDATKFANEYAITAPATDVAKQWEGWGTALKPAHEPIVVARKPLAEKTVAANVLKYGTGGINIDACRVVRDADDHSGWSASGSKASDNDSMSGPNYARDPKPDAGGRWPPNVLLTHSEECKPIGTRQVRNQSGSVSGDELSKPTKDCYGEYDRVPFMAYGDHGLESVEAWECVPGCPVKEIDRQSGTRKSAYPGRPDQATAYAGTSVNGDGATYLSDKDAGLSYSDVGGASRFFSCFKYQAKAPKSQRPTVDGVAAHPTVKPIELMQWLVRLVTPSGGIVLDPFAGTGTTGEACLEEGFKCVLIEKDEGYLKLIQARLDAREPTLW